MGPVLGLRQASSELWTVGVLVLGDAEPAVRYRVGAGAWATVAGVAIGGAWLPGAWRFDLRVPLAAEETAVEYSVGDASFGFRVPAVTAMPRIAYGSCNGFASLKLQKSVKANKNERWVHLAKRHQELPFHLLLLGGDQVYGDELWETNKALKDWNALDWADGNRRGFSQGIRETTRRFYSRLYPSRWGQPEVAAVLSSIPTLMMWDDHDIFDGWGSYQPERQASPVFQGVFEEAREAFRVFQRQSSPQEAALPGDSGSLAPQHGFSFAHVFGGGKERVAVLALDMRSQRTDEQVLSKEHWDALFVWLDGQMNLRHLLVMSSIPVVYPSFEIVERLLARIPGHQELEDDLRDHWSSRPHRGERLRLVHRLLAFARNCGTRVTILSGDVHVGAVGVIRSEREGGETHASVVNQLTSSAIVHPPPPALLLFALEHLIGRTEEIDRGIQGELHAFPGTERRYIGARNWLALEPDPPGGQGRLWANWHVEGEPRPYTKVVHPVT